jgi:hypothetical protein
MNIYIEACGEKHVCLDWPGLTNYEPHPILSRCPPCSCEEYCADNQNCCPDKFFQRPLAKLDQPHLYVATKERLIPGYLEKKYEIVSNCPKYATKSEIKECNCPKYVTKSEIKECKTPSGDFKHIHPVTSLVSNYSYRNIACAFCHGETDTNLVTWDLSFKGDIVNFESFIETPQQLLRLAKLFKLNVAFSPPPNVEGIVRSINLNPQENLEETCTDDSDLHVACSSSYVHQFKLHKNIFCYLCKLRKHKRSGPWIDTCLSKNNEVAQKCLKAPTSNLTYPYKNFYCFHCNVPMLLSRAKGKTQYNREGLKYYFTDFSATLHEGYHRDAKRQKKIQHTFL